MRVTLIGVLVLAFAGIGCGGNYGDDPELECQRAGFKHGRKDALHVVCWNDDGAEVTFSLGLSQ